MARKSKRTVVCSATIEELNINECYIVDVLNSQVQYQTYVSKKWYDETQPEEYRIVK